MLLRCCLIPLYYYTETHFIFSVFVSMSRPRSINAHFSDLFFIFSLIFHCHYSYNFIKIDTLHFFTVFKASPIVFE